MQTAGLSEMFLHFYKATRFHIPEHTSRIIRIYHPEDVTLWLYFTTIYIV